MSAPTSSTDLAVVTSCWGDYSQWLPDWAQSITSQTVKPKQVVIADLGVRYAEPLYHAIDLLVAAGIDAYPVWGLYEGMGAARNTAVAASTTPWVMHLDADDRLLPWAVADIEQVQPHADVVCIGGRRNRRPVLFPKASAERVLAGYLCCFSCAPFRRELWEQRPYQTHNDWIDSVFWVGFAHLGARFVPTERPGFIYRDHEGSFSHRLSPSDRQAASNQWRRACAEWTLT